MRILFVDENHPVLHETLQNAGLQCDLFWDKSTEALLRLLPEYEGLVIRSRFKITKALIDECSRLKYIGRVGAGMENIDAIYATSKGIVCVNAPEGNRDAVAEHALGMLLMLQNHLKKVDGEVRNGIWIRAENRGHEIMGSTIGIIGYGHTGSAFARKLSGMDCTILAYDKYKRGFANASVKEATMNDLYEQCDVVSIHVPLNEETRYFINNEFFSRFKKSVVFINTSRGLCLKTADLVRALESGKVKGACLDVLEYESVSFDFTEEDRMPDPLQYLIHSDKVLLSPHIAGWTYESNYKMSKLVAERIIAAIKTKS